MTILIMVGFTILVVATCWKATHFVDGALARMWNEPISTCPYKPGDARRDEWLRGYDHTGNRY